MNKYYIYSLNLHTQQKEYFIDFFGDKVLYCESKINACISILNDYNMNSTVFVKELVN